ncbi:DUF3040 domain-containing protein [Pseudonocardia sp. GCM10023141]|uniref:DUF3040 domain-containing protein n=1 Tax=Pseudonocardia sp. GCM10023141 TaxID=3252653 RepID=UPI0036167714
MSLSEHERRELRETGQAMRASDPRLAGLLTSSRPVPDGESLRWVAGSFVAISVGLIIAGLLIPDSDLVVIGCLAPSLMPPVVLAMAAVTDWRRR